MLHLLRKLRRKPRIVVVVDLLHDAAHRLDLCGDKGLIHVVVRAFRVELYPNLRSSLTDGGNQYHHGSLADLGRLHDVADVNALKALDLCGVGHDPHEADFSAKVQLTDAVVHDLKAGAFEVILPDQVHEEFVGGVCQGVLVFTSAKHAKRPAHHFDKDGPAKAMALRPTPSPIRDLIPSRS